MAENQIMADKIESVEEVELTNEELKELLQIDDDNKLVTYDDLESNSDSEESPVMTNLWSDPERLKKLNQEMNKLAKVRNSTEKFPDTVLNKAMGEVLNEVTWDNYESFKQTVKNILESRTTKNNKSPPFSILTKNKQSGEMNFWIVKVFINVGENVNYEVDNKKYNKKEVLMSRQFCNYLKSFCKEVLKDEVQFWSFTGSYEGKQHLDMSVSRVRSDELKILMEMNKETNANNLVMFQFKHKNPEVYVGRKNLKNNEKKVRSNSE